MNRLSKHLVQVECPVCKMGIGQVCFVSGDTCRMYHNERLTLADTMFPTKKVYVPKVMGVKYRDGVLSGCRTQGTHRCQGFKQKYGLRTSCTCKCHKEKKTNGETPDS